MKQKPRGACIIITNKDYSETRRDRRPGTRRRRSSKQKPGVNLEDMVGTEKDITSLRKLFEWLHFEVATFENLKSAEMLNLLRSYSRMDHTPYDCFVCCISSHGCPKGIYGTDGKQLDVDRLTDLFRGESCQSLINKPKLFFIDACRGNLRDSGYKPDRQSSGRASVTKEGTSKRTQRESVSPHESDFFIGYSTPPGNIILYIYEVGWLKYHVTVKPL